MSQMKIVLIEPDELNQLIADAVRSALAEHPSKDEWVTARDSGLGHRRFLRLANDGAFPVSKRGKTYVARRSDIDAYLISQRIRPVQATPLTPLPAALIADPIAAVLAQGRLRIVKKSP
jgi:hypothetical protein